MQRQRVEAGSVHVECFCELSRSYLVNRGYKGQRKDKKDWSKVA